jgi:SAM-dependent methyltransferase
MTTKTKARALLAHYNGNARLSIGCGFDVQEGFIGIDIRPSKNPNHIQHDLEDYPWPFPDSAFAVAAATMVIEHINPAKLGTVRFMNEIWRVMKPGAQLMLAVPYGMSPMSITDPGHTRCFTETTWFYFDPLNQSGMWKTYRPRPWKLLACTFQTHGLMEVVMEKRREDPQNKSAYA